MTIAYAPPYPSAWVRPVFDDAVSSAARSLRASIADALEPVHSMASRRMALAQEMLEEAIRESKHVVVSQETVAQTLAFLRSIPTEVPLPDAVVESDGEIGLDWDFDQRRVLSVSVGDGPMLRYAALIGAEPVYGRIPYAGVLPETLSYILKRIQHV